MAERISEFQQEYEEHIPWFYTEFGTICSCGRPVDSNEECALQVKIRAVIEEMNEGND
jgi:histidine triad (HIT) family protein